MISNAACAGGYRLVFDASQVPPNLFVVSLVLVLVWVGWFRWRILRSFARRLFLGAALVALGITVFAVLATWSSVEIAVSGGAPKQLTGLVQGFQPLLEGQRGTEQFTLDGITFQYGSSGFMSGFGATAAQGGSIRENCRFG